MNSRFMSALALAALLSVVGGGAGHAVAQTASTAVTQTHYRTIRAEGVEMAYREAGSPDAPTVLLLHGFPTSSRMFRNLIPALAGRYHVIAPDYPGFGASLPPDRNTFHYTFAAYADLVDRLVTKLGVQRYALYVQDYGAPIGYRLALAHPERVSALVIQNGNAYEEGLSPFWNPIRAYWVEPSAEKRKALRAGLTPEATRAQYVDGVTDPSHIDPENWFVDQVLLDRPGIDEIMLDLFYDYRTNADLYPQFSPFSRKKQPLTLIVWGKNDIIFPAGGARAYSKDLPKAEPIFWIVDIPRSKIRGRRLRSLMRAFLDRSLQR